MANITLMVLAQITGSVNSKYFPNTQSDEYWTSSLSVASGDGVAWIVKFDMGYTTTGYGNFEKKFVRLVH